jgi:hypothetical protein
MGYGMRRNALLVCALTVATIVGCSNEEATDRAATSAASGTVTYKGSPVAGAIVTLVTADSNGHGATGKTDESGNFSLMTSEPGDGAIPGSYRVTVVAGALPAGITDEDIVIGDVESDAAAPKGGESSKISLPKKYASAETSDLTAEITEGKNELSFELAD